MRRPARIKVTKADRRVDRCHRITAPLRVCIWKFVLPEWETESEYQLETGFLFGTDWAARAGMAVEVFLKLPEEITCERTTEWLHTGRIIRAMPIDSPCGR
jgi:hypothetical protein